MVLLGNTSPYTMAAEYKKIQEQQMGTTHENPPQLRDRDKRPDEATRRETP